MWFMGSCNPARSMYDASCLSAPPSVPLPPPTSQFELYRGHLHGHSVTLIDTPGLPCSLLPSALHALLPHLHRVVFVVDSESDWMMDLAAEEIAGIAREMREQRATRGMGGAGGGGGYTAQQRPVSAGGGQESKSRRHPLSQQHVPSMHIVCTKQVEAPAPTVATTNRHDNKEEERKEQEEDEAHATHALLSAAPPTLTPSEIAAYMQLPFLSSPGASSPPPSLHGWNCLWPFSRLLPILSAIVSPQGAGSGVGVAAATSTGGPIDVLAGVGVGGVGSGHSDRPLGAASSRRRKTGERPFTAATGRKGGGNSSFDAAAVAQASHPPLPPTSLQLALPSSIDSSSPFPSSSTLLHPPPLTSPSSVHLVYPFPSSGDTTSRVMFFSPSVAPTRRRRSSAQRDINSSGGGVGSIKAQGIVLTHANGSTSAGS